MTNRQKKNWKRKRAEKSRGIYENSVVHFVEEDHVSALMIEYKPTQLMIGPLMDYQSANQFRLNGQVFELRALSKQDGAVVRNSENKIFHMETRGFVTWVVRKALSDLGSGNVRPMSEQMNKSA